MVRRQNPNPNRIAVPSRIARWLVAHARPPAVISAVATPLLFPFSSREYRARGRPAAVAAATGAHAFSLSLSPFSFLPFSFLLPSFFSFLPSLFLFCFPCRMPERRPAARPRYPGRAAHARPPRVPRVPR
jgi:hypothetical protein